ncbi:MAG TPA: alpha/beta fold hydrolase [Ginsengibacter sp.]|nr:alpha/beta fold hydrolase [Ginsengibacter sp.]
MKRIKCKTIIEMRTIAERLTALPFEWAKGLARSIIILAGLMCSTSCSFNRQFLKPDIIPANTTRARLAEAGADSIIVLFNPTNHQPVFTTNGTDILNLPFTIESVVFKSANGNLLNGWFLKPKDVKPTVTLLHLHGNGGSLLTQYQAISPLTKYGFQIFVFDYSGFGFSEGKATTKNVLIDANSALNYLKAREDIRNTPIVIYGQSLGGHLAAVLASRKQSEVDGLVLEGAFSSPKDIAAKQAGFIGRLLVRQRYSAVKSIEKYHKPVLIIHSTEDKTVPLEMGQKLFEHANTPKSFYEIRKCHICGPQFYADSISTKINNMIHTKV